MRLLRQAGQEKSDEKGEEEIAPEGTVIRNCSFFCQT